MADIERNYFFNDVLLVIAENLQVKIAEQVEIYLIPVVPNAHHARAMLMNQANLLLERLALKIHEGDHG